MIISHNMNLDYLNERMSNTVAVSREDAEAMREMLVAEFDGTDTRDVPQPDWDRMLQAL